MKQDKPIKVVFDNCVFIKDTVDGKIKVTRPATPSEVTSYIESKLNEFGVPTRDDNGNFRDINKILEDISKIDDESMKEISYLLSTGRLD